jgi:hypothetical protein
MATDFRTQAAEATLNRLRSVGAQSLADLDTSGCLFIPGGLALRYALELPSLAIVLGCALSLLAGVLLAMREVLSRPAALALTLACLLVLLIFRKGRSALLRFILSLRRNGLIKAFPDLPVLDVAIEETETVQKVKLLSEDEGVCLLDTARQRLMIEGCSFRYVICAKDVSLIRPVSRYGLSAVQVIFNAGDHQIDMVIKASGQGPLASLVQAFAPRRQAADLSWILDQTLFGVSAVPGPPTLPQR